MWTQEFTDKLADLMNTYPPLWMLYGFVLILPFVLMACCFIKPKSKVRIWECACEGEGARVSGVAASPGCDLWCSLVRLEVGILGWACVLTVA